MADNESGDNELRKQILETIIGDLEIAVGAVNRASNTAKAQDWKETHWNHIHAVVENAWCEIDDALAFVRQTEVTTVTTQSEGAR